MSRRRPRTERLVDGIVLAIAAAVVFFIAAGLAGLAFGDEHTAGTPPRVLFVWHDPCTANSRQFFDDLQLTRLGDELAAAGWRVEQLNVRRRPLQAFVHGIAATPCFVVPGRMSWYGYDPRRFRELFGLTPADDQPLPISAPEQLEREQVQQWIADQFVQQRGEFEQQLAATLDADQRRQLAIEQTLAQQQQQLADLADGDPATEQRLAEIRLLIEQLARDQVQPPATSSEVTSPAAATPDATCPITPPATGDQVRPSTLSTLVKVGGFSLTVLQALGLVGATSTGFGGVGVWLLLRFLNRRRQVAGTSSPSTPAPPAIVTMQSPPAPQATYRETTFVPVEVDTFAEAFAWAEVEIGRAYPGAVGNLQQIRSLITQFLAARGMHLKPKR